ALPICRQTTKEPRGPATSASARPASRALSRKSAMFAVFVVYVRFQHGAMQVMGMVVVVVIDRHAAGILAEQLDEGRVVADLFRMPRATHMAVEADDLVGGAHDQVQIVGYHQYAAAEAVAQSADQAVE